jgi:hypothetical protein
MKLLILDFCNLLINIKFSIEFEQNIVNIHFLDHSVRPNIFNIIVEASSESQTKVSFQFSKL